MPINGPLLAGLIQTEFASVGFVGQAIPQLSLAIGNGIALNILASAVYTGTSTGLGIGSGTSTGVLSGGIIIGPAVSNLIYLQMTALGLIGSSTLQFATAVGNAVATHMATAVVQGISTIVAIGSGTGIITGILGPTMGSSILLQMTAAGLIGQSASQLANAIANGVAAAFATAIATTAIVGVAVGPVPPAFPPIPSIGTDVGRLL